jgi:hypothetical protein
MLLAALDIGIPSCDPIRARGVIRVTRRVRLLSRSQNRQRVEAAVENGADTPSRGEMESAETSVPVGRRKDEEGRGAET